MAALMDRLDPEPERSRLVLVATSGDTGGAVAHAVRRHAALPGRGVVSPRGRE